MDKRNYFIFRCSSKTYNECIVRGLFGQTLSMSRFVSDVKKGDILFLHNVSTSEIEGPFIAESDGSMDIAPDAWGGGFPAQVKVSKLKNSRSFPTSEALKQGLTYSYQNRYFDFHISESIGLKLSGNISGSDSDVLKDIKL